MRAFESIGLIFFCNRMHHEHFWGRQFASLFLIYVRKYRKYTIDRWTVVYTVCASAVIDFAIKTVVRFLEKLVNCQTTRWEPLGWSRLGSNQKQCCGFDFTKWHDIYIPEECADEWRQNTLILSHCFMNGVIMFGIMFKAATALESSPQSFDV